MKELIYTKLLECLTVRADMAVWYNNKQYSLPLNKLAGIELEFQIGIFISYLLSNGILLAITDRSYDVILITPTWVLKDIVKIQCNYNDEHDFLLIKTTIDIHKTYLENAVFAISSGIEFLNKNFKELKTYER